MKVFNVENGVVIKSWCESPEDGCIQQAKNMSKLPFIYKHIALMPDVHMGFGVPIGSVMACNGVVIPNAVGVDIGCSVSAVKTNLIWEDNFNKDDIKRVMGNIRERIPVGFRHHDKGCAPCLMPYIEDLDADRYKICVEEYESARRQMMTLGGGNHFIEIQKDDEGYIWFMTHCGSRNLGKKVADHYNKLAKELNGKWHSSVPLNYDLAFLPEGTKQYDDYLCEMDFCLEFAKRNHLCIMDEICGIFAKEGKGFDVGLLKYVRHNFASMEYHFGKIVMVHRKGATPAGLGDLGIIPGSQGTSSYIVMGLGNPESFMSCSHGAGRKMGRKEAQRSLNLEEEIKKLDDKGILHSIRGREDLDESPSVYKDIDVVMEEQKDLVEIVTKLTPLGVIKG